MTVNDLARRVGIPAHVVRYYTQCGLLSPARNARNAYREYGEDDLHRLQFICKVKTIGFTLNEIAMILEAVDDEAARFSVIRDLLRARAEQYRRRLASAQRLQQQIMAAVERWNEPDEHASERVKLQRLIAAVALHEEDDGLSAGKD